MQMQIWLVNQHQATLVQPAVEHGHKDEHLAFAGTQLINPVLDSRFLRGWWRNRVSRILLVFILSTLGSAVGTYLAGFRIFDRLTG